MNLDFVLYDVIDSKENYYIFTSTICCSLATLEIAKGFDAGQIEKLTSYYLKKLASAGLLSESKYPHTNVSRYRKTDLFYESNHLPKIEVEFKSQFLLDLNMQRAISDFEIFECTSMLEAYSKKNTHGAILDKIEEQDYLATKEKLQFIKNKVRVIDTLIDIYQLELG